MCLLPCLHILFYGGKRDPPAAMPCEAPENAGLPLPPIGNSRAIGVRLSVSIARTGS